MTPNSFPSGEVPVAAPLDTHPTGSSIATAAARVRPAEVLGKGEPLRLAYLVPIYPMVSQSFIRREVAAVEAHGLTVHRYSLRRWSEVLVDPLDVAEQQRTRVVLDVGASGLLRAILATAVTWPRRFWRATKLAMRLGRRSQRGLLLHAIYLAEACVLRQWFQDEQVEHIHVHYGTNAAAVALLCQTLGGPSYSLTIHGACDLDNASSESLDVKVAGAIFAVAVSSYLRSQLYRCVPYEHWSKIRVVHCGLDETFLNVTATTPPSERRLAYIGRLSEEKGLPVLMRAARHLKDQGLSFELVLAGDGPMRPLVEDVIDRLGLSDFVRIIGWQTSTQVRELICRSRALVLPSYMEGLPVVLMEALALSRPVISTYVAGIPELVLPGINGWLVPPSSVEDLAAALRAALEASPLQLERMGRAGAERVLREHNALNEATRLVSLFRTATRRSSAAATSDPENLSLGASADLTPGMAFDRPLHHLG
jgi:glycosyltransferase involved in cell wall biosynthesis